MPDQYKSQFMNKTMTSNERKIVDNEEIELQVDQDASNANPMDYGARAKPHTDTIKTDAMRD